MKWDHAGANVCVCVYVYVCVRACVRERDREPGTIVRYSQYA